jgi:hypothetical protein
MKKPVKILSRIVRWWTGVPEEVEPEEHEAPPAQVFVPYAWKQDPQLVQEAETVKKVQLKRAHARSTQSDWMSGMQNEVDSIMNDVHAVHSQNKRHANVQHIFGSQPD